MKNIQKHAEITLLDENRMRDKRETRDWMLVTLKELIPWNLGLTLESLRASNLDLQ